MKIKQSMCPYIADHPYGILIIEGSGKKKHYLKQIYY